MNGSWKGRATCDNCTLLKQIIETNSTYIAVVDYEKAFGQVSKNILWHILYKRVYPKHLMDVLKEFVYGH